MKKIFGIALVLAVLTTLCFGSVALADDPDDVVTTTWSGSGTVAGTVTAGDDATTTFQTSGASISGSFAATDSNNNPYSYGVDNFSVYLNASVSNGYIDTWCDRTDSYVPMYGSDGQHSWSFVGVDGGNASMAYRSTTNFAQMTDGSYGYQLPGGHNIVVGAGTYLIDRGIADGTGNSGYVFATGTGTATLDCMVSGASGVWPLTLGRGGGCYTDANYNATGSGYFEVTGTGNTSVVFNGLGMSSGGGSLSIIANFVSGFSISDYSLTAQ